MDGKEVPFSVETCEMAPTEEPKDRQPPQYLNGLRYDPKRKIAEEPEKKKSHNLRQTEQRKKEEKTTPPNKKESKPQSHNLKTKGREDLRYAIIQDCALGQYYVAKIIQSDGEQKAHLHQKAKKGQYHPIWYDPNDITDPPRSKSQPSQPKGWEPWLVMPDATWKIIEPVTNQLKLLDLSLVK